MRRHPRVQLQPRRQVSGRSWLRAATGIAGRRSERRRQAGREGGRHAPCKCVASVVDTAQAERLRVSLRVAREGRCVCVGRVTRHQHITQPPCARKHRHATRCSFPCNLQFILSKLANCNRKLHCPNTATTAKGCPQLLLPEAGEGGHPAALLARCGRAGRARCVQTTVQDCVQIAVYETAHCPSCMSTKGGAEGNSIPITQTLRNRVCVGSGATEFVQLYAPVARPNQSAYAHSCR